MEGNGHLEFYGQRPWRPGKLSGEPPDPQVEARGFQALQFLEKQVNHSVRSLLIFNHFPNNLNLFSFFRT